MVDLHENLNIRKYIEKVTSLYNKLCHMLIEPCQSEEIIQVFKDSQGTILSVRIEARNDITHRMKWRKSKEIDMIGILCCDEIVERNSTGDYVRTSFSFDYRPQEGKETQAFRIDLDQSSPTPLHAHDDKQLRHLVFPDNVSLNLYHIDFCTIMVVVSYYIKNSNIYPLHNGDVYNKLIKKQRSRYDEFGKC